MLQVLSSATLDLRLSLAFLFIVHDITQAGDTTTLFAGLSPLRPLWEAEERELRSEVGVPAASEDSRKIIDGSQIK